MSSELRATERPNERTGDLDLMSPLQIVTLINQEDQGVAVAVSRCIEPMARAVEAIRSSFQRGGRLIYVGAGTSGRLGVLDASECPPTFSTPPEMILGLIAGGDRALRHASEGAEDIFEDGETLMDGVAVSNADTVVGITASGRTPYVQGALRRARKEGAVTVLVTCNARPELTEDCDILIAPETGPEVVTGSTRLKAGTATKMVLNTLSTASLALSGKVFSNLMVDLRPGSYKLVHRAQWILTQLVGVDGPAAAELFETSGRNVKVAVLMGRRRLDRAQAEVLLERHGGYLRRALDDPPEVE